MSDGEENNPVVDGDLPHDFDIMSVEQQPDDYEYDNSLTGSPEVDFNEDYSLPDAAESDHLITEGYDRENESKPDFFLVSIICFNSVAL